MPTARTSNTAWHGPCPAARGLIASLSAAPSTAPPSILPAEVFRRYLPTYTRTPVAFLGDRFFAYSAFPSKLRPLLCYHLHLLHGGSRWLAIPKFSEMFRSSLCSITMKWAYSPPRSR